MLSSVLAAVAARALLFVVAGVSQEQGGCVRAPLLPLPFHLLCLDLSLESDGQASTQDG